MSSTEMNEAKIQEVVPEEVAGTASSIKDETTHTSKLTIDETKPESVRTLALIKPDAMRANNKEAIISIIKKNNFIISQEQEIQLTKEKAGLFYKEHTGKPFYEDLTNWMSSSPIYALVLEKPDAIQAWRDLMGPTNAIKAREEKPDSIRALFGTDGSHNATHGSDSFASAEREIELIFGQPTETLSTIKEVKPLVKEVKSNEICKPDAANNDAATVDKEVEQAKIAEPVTTTPTHTPTSDPIDDAAPKDEHVSTKVSTAAFSVDEIDNSKAQHTAAEADKKSSPTDQAEIILIEPSSTNDISSVLEPVSNTASTVATRDDEAEKPNVREGSSAEDEATFTNEEDAITKQQQQQQDPLIKEHFSEEDFIVNANSKNSPVEEEEEEKITFNTADKDEEEGNKAVEEEDNIDIAEAEEPRVVSELTTAGPDTVVEKSKAAEALPVKEAVAEEKESKANVVSSVDDEKLKSDIASEEISDSLKENESNHADTDVVEEKKSDDLNVNKVEEEKDSNKQEEPEKPKKSVGALVTAFEEAVATPEEETTVKSTTDIPSVDTHVDVKDLTAAFDQQEKDAIPEEETQQAEHVTQEKNEANVVSATPVVNKDEVLNQESVDENAENDVIESERSTTQEVDKEDNHIIPTSETTGDADTVPTRSTVEEEKLSRTAQDVTMDENKAAPVDNVVVEETNNKQELSAEDPAFIPEEVLNEAKIDDDVSDKKNTLEQLPPKEPSAEKDENKEEIKIEEDQMNSTTTSLTNASEEEDRTSEDHQSENSSVTNSNTTSSSNEKNKEVIGETIKKSNKVSSVNIKKELKPKAPITKQPTTRSGIDGDKKKGATATTRRTLTKPSQPSSTGTKKTPITVKKPTTTGKEPATDKPTTKPARVPRVALLTKKAAAPPVAATETEEKPKKASSTRSLVSRLTAPTAASARRKDITSGTPASSAAASGVRKSDPTHKKVNTTTSPPTTTTATKKTIKKAPMTSSRVPTATSAKPTTTTGAVRRTTPPSSTGTSKKSSEATHAIKQQRIATSVNNKIGTRASGLPKTTKKEVPTAVQKKSSATPRKKPVTAASTSAATSASAIKEETISAAPSTTTTSEHSCHEEENDSVETPLEADVISEDQKTESDIVHKGEEENHVVQVDENTHTNKEIEHKQQETEHKEGVEHKEEKLNEDHTINEEEVTLAKEEKVTPAKDEEEVHLVENNEVEPTIKEEKAEAIKVVEPTVQEEVEATNVVEPPVDEKDATISVIISEDSTPQVTESHHDAEVAAITQPTSSPPAAIKPQMASLRSKFENLNNNTTNQLPASKSKELRSKSPNRISDMINRFS